MDDNLNRQADRLKTLSNPTCIQIVHLLSQTPQLNVSELSNQLKIEASLMSKYLVKMKDRGVLSSTRQKNKIFYALADPIFEEVLRLILNRVLKQNVSGSMNA